MVLKWEGNIRKPQAAEIAPTRAVDNRKARKNQANTDAAASPFRGNVSNSDRNAEEGCGDGRGVLILVLGVEQLFQLFL
jgi:hypothetical protein